MKSIFIILSAPLITLILSLNIQGCGQKNELAFNVTPDNWPPGLGQEQVQLDNIAVKNYYIIFDGSGSMHGEKLKVAKKAVKEFISLIPDNANIALLAFDKTSNSERAKLGSPKELILAKIDTIRPGGSTPLGASMKIAYKKLIAQGRKQLGYGEYNMVIITDGKASDKSAMKKITNSILAGSPVTIHTIGFKIGQGHALNQPGKIYYKAANNYEELSKGLESVLAEAENFTITTYKE